MHDTICSMVPRRSASASCIGRHTGRLCLCPGLLALFPPAEEGGRSTQLLVTYHYHPSGRGC